MNTSAPLPLPSTLTAARSANGAWFCLRTHCKHEHLAGRWLKRYLGIETYAPRMRIRRAQKRGPVWFTEAVFPNYLFARFDLAGSLAQVEAAPGIRHTVRFGNCCPCIPDQAIEGLRAAIGSSPIRVLDEPLSPGETVLLAEGPFAGLQAVITGVLPGRQRVAVLLDFLGRQTRVELAAASVVRVEDERRGLLG